MITTPKPKKDDSVEMKDLSRILGKVTKVIGDHHVKVLWEDKTPNYESIEDLQDLTIIKRV